MVGFNWDFNSLSFNSLFFLQKICSLKEMYLQNNCFGNCCKLLRFFPPRHTVCRGGTTFIRDTQYAGAELQPSGTTAYVWREDWPTRVSQAGFERVKFWRQRSNIQSNIVIKNGRKRHFKELNLTIRIIIINSWN